VDSLTQAISAHNDFTDKEVKDSTSDKLADAEACAWIAREIL